MGQALTRASISKIARFANGPPEVINHGVLLCIFDYHQEAQRTCARVSRNAMWSPTSAKVTAREALLFTVPCN